MKNKANEKKSGKIKSFLSGLMEKLDKRMEKKAKSAKSCCGDNPKEGPCCS